MSIPLATLAAESPAQTAAGACAASDEALCRWALEGAAPLSTDRQRLAEIYARPGFEDAASRGKDGWEHLLAELGRFFEDLFGTSGAQGFAEWTRFLILTAAALAAVWVFYRLVLRLRAGRRRLPRAVPALHDTAPAAAQAGRVHLRRARGLVEASPREGIREGLLGLLAALEGAGLSRPERVRTNRELARELPARGAPAPLVSEVRDLLAWYDRAFYSLGRVTEAEARGFLTSVEALVTTLPEASA